MKKMLTFTHLRQAMSTISLLLTIIAVSAIAIKGFNWGLDFTGGVITEFRVDQQLTSEQLLQTFQGSTDQTALLTSTDEAGRWVIRYSNDGQPISSLSAILEPLTDEVQILTNSIVGPQVGSEMVEQGGLAVLTCILLTLGYLSWRFDWRLALGALGALVHDITLVLGLFALTGMEFDLTVLAAVLAVLGYSLNDSIVIADRVRELFRANPNGRVAPLINSAVKATLTRTMITSGTTFGTVACLWLLGGAPLQGFAIALCLGIVSGTWSSISVGLTIPQLLKISPNSYAQASYDDRDDAFFEEDYSAKVSRAQQR